MLKSYFLLLINNKDLLKFLIKKEFYLKYNNSVAGWLWSFINPFLLITLYFLIFGPILKNKVSFISFQTLYAIYLCIGIIFYNFFTEVSNNIMSLFFNYSYLLKKIKIPSSIFLALVVTNAIINFSIMMIIFLILNFIFYKVSFSILSFLFSFLLLLSFSIFLGLVLLYLNTLSKDISIVFSNVTTFLFWLTPIIYPINILPEKFQFIIKLNPLTHIIGYAQSNFVKETFYDLQYLIILFLFSLFGIYIFSKIINKNKSLIIEKI